LTEAPYRGLFFLHFLCLLVWVALQTLAADTIRFLSQRDLHHLEEVFMGLFVNAFLKILDV